MRSGATLPVGSRLTVGAMGSCKLMAAERAMPPPPISAFLAQRRRTARPRLGATSGTAADRQYRLAAAGHPIVGRPLPNRSRVIGIDSILERCRLLDNSLRQDERVAESMATVQWWHSRTRLVSSTGADHEQTHHAGAQCQRYRQRQWHDTQSQPRHAPGESGVV